MSKTTNEVFLLGNLGDDPKFHDFPDGGRVANLSLATNDYRGKDSPEKVNWHRLSVYGNLVKVVEQFVRKGDRIFVRGELDYRTTEAPDGTVQYWTSIRVRDLTLLGSASGGGGGNVGQGGPREYTSPPPERNGEIPF